MELLASQKSSFSFSPVKNGLIFSGIVRVLLGVLFIMRTSNPEISKAYLEPSQVSKTETHYRFTNTMCI